MEDRSFYVYAHYRLDTMEPFYIGKGREGRANKLNRNSLHDNISKKHGHAVVILYDNLTEEEAFFYEREVIEDLVYEEGYEIYCNNIEVTKQYSYLTNFTFGGEGQTGFKQSKETIEKISIAIKKRNESPEARKKQSEAIKKYYENEKEREKISIGVKKHYESPEARKKQSEAVKKRYKDPKEREKTSIAVKKHYESPEARKKQSEAIKTSWDNLERKKAQSKKLSGENNGLSKYHKVIINNKIIIGRYLDETINISKQYIDNINRNWFKKSKGIPKKFKNIVSIEEISKEDYYILLQNKNIISYVNAYK